MSKTKPRPAKISVYKNGWIYCNAAALALIATRRVDMRADTDHGTIEILEDNAGEFEVVGSHIRAGRGFLKPFGRGFRVKLGPYLLKANVDGVLQFRRVNGKQR